MSEYRWRIVLWTRRGYAFAMAVLARVAPMASLGLGLAMLALFKSNAAVYVPSIVLIGIPLLFWLTRWCMDFKAVHWLDTYQRARRENDMALALDQVATHLRKMPPLVPRSASPPPPPRD